MKPIYTNHPGIPGTIFAPTHKSGATVASNSPTSKDVRRIFPPEILRGANIGVLDKEDESNDSDLYDLLYGGGAKSTNALKAYRNWGLRIDAVFPAMQSGLYGPVFHPLTGIPHKSDWDYRIARWGALGPAVSTFDMLIVGMYFDPPDKLNERLTEHEIAERYVESEYIDNVERVIQCAKPSWHPCPMVLAGVTDWQWWDSQAWVERDDNVLLSRFRRLFKSPAFDGVWVFNQSHDLADRDRLYRLVEQARKEAA